MARGERAVTDWVKTRILEPLQQLSAWKSVLFTPVSLVPLPRNDDFLMAEKVMVSAARSGNGLDVLVRQTRRADPFTISETDPQQHHMDVLLQENPHPFETRLTASGVSKSHTPR